MTAPATAFAVPAFRRLWTAGLVSDAGDWLLFIALPLLVLRLTGSAFGTAFAFLLELLPPVLLAPIAGRLVDRLPRRRLLLATTLGQAAVITALTVAPERGALPLVYGVIVGQAVLTAVFEPAKNAVLPTLVGPERIVSANALVGLNNDLGRLVGGPLGGLIFGLAGIRVVAAVDLASYLAAAALIATLPAVSGPAAGGRPRPENAGLLAPLRRPAIRAPLLVTLLASVAQGMFVVLFVFFVTGVLHGSDADVGLLRGVQAVGAIGAGALLGARGVRSGLARLTLLGCAAFALLTVLTWNLSFATDELPGYLVLFAAVGAPAVLMSAGLASQLQVGATDADRGRVFALFGLAQAAGQGLGLLLAGTLQGVLGTMPLLELQAGCYVATAALAALVLPRGARQPQPA